MKITEQQLKQIIREETQKALNEKAPFFGQELPRPETDLDARGRVIAAALEAGAISVAPWLLNKTAAVESRKPGYGTKNWPYLSKACRGEFGPAEDGSAKVSPKAYKMCRGLGGEELKACYKKHKTGNLARACKGIKWSEETKYGGKPTKTAAQLIPWKAGF